MITLPDVNVLIALAWPNHVHHDPARSWFAANLNTGWATCPLTEAGFVRLSCNRLAVKQEAFGLPARPPTRAGGRVASAKYPPRKKSRQSAEEGCAPSCCTESAAAADA